MICCYCKKVIKDSPINILGSDRAVCSMECGSHLMITDKMRELRKEKIMYEITITQKTIKKVPSGKSWEIIK